MSLSRKRWVFIGTFVTFRTWVKWGFFLNFKFKCTLNKLLKKGIWDLKTNWSENFRIFNFDFFFSFFFFSLITLNTVYIFRLLIGCKPLWMFRLETKWYKSCVNFTKSTIRWRNQSKWFRVKDCHPYSFPLFLHFSIVIRRCTYRFSVDSVWKSQGQTYPLTSRVGIINGGVD